MLLKAKSNPQALRIAKQKGAWATAQGLFSQLFYHRQQMATVPTGFWAKPSRTKKVHPCGHFGDQNDWTTGGPYDGNEWKKYRFVPHAHPSRPLAHAYFSRSGSKRAFSLPGATWDHVRCAVEPSPSHIRCRIFPELANVIFTCDLHVEYFWEFLNVSGLIVVLSCTVSLPCKTACKSHMRKCLGINKWEFACCLHLDVWGALTVWNFLLEGNPPFGNAYIPISVIFGANSTARTYWYRYRSVLRCQYRYRHPPGLLSVKIYRSVILRIDYRKLTDTETDL